MRDYIRFNLQPRLHEVMHQWPYFNRSGGFDHLVVYVGDNGPIGDCMSHLDNAPLVRSMLMSMVRALIFFRSTVESILTSISLVSYRKSPFVAVF
jgi:hypothetical protein